MHFRHRDDTKRRQRRSGVERSFSPRGRATRRPPMSSQAASTSSGHPPHQGARFGRFDHPLGQARRCRSAPPQAQGAPCGTGPRPNLLVPGLLGDRPVREDPFANASSPDHGDSEPAGRDPAWFHRMPPGTGPGCPLGCQRSPLPRRGRSPGLECSLSVSARSCGRFGSEDVHTATVSWVGRLRPGAPGLKQASGQGCTPQVRSSG